MSQKHIRRLTGFGWVKRAWLRLHEPRVLSTAYGVWYLIMAGVWLRAFFEPPQTIENTFGTALVSIISVLIVLGGVTGVATVLNGAYWAERTAVALIILGLTGYLALTLTLEVVGTGNRQPGMGSTLGAIGFTWLRAWWIYDRPYNPRRRSLA